MRLDSPEGSLTPSWLTVSWSAELRMQRFVNKVHPLGTIGVRLRNSVGVF